MTTHGEGDLVSPSVRLVRELGVGGMGRVWLADHLSLRAQVVVKFLALDLLTDQENVERFAQEAHSASQVRSPHVCQVLDHGVSPRGEPFIVMEHLEGRDLRKALSEKNRIALGDMAVIVAHVAKALSRAHQRGIIHRDIKPENIFLCDHGEREIFVKLLDFGIAKRTDATSLNTASGMVMGTAPYMSPEQLMGKKLDHRSDLWSLGVVVFEAVTGQLPFQGDTVGALTMSVHDATRPRASTVYPELGSVLDGWFTRALSILPANRFATATELSDAFAAAIGLPIPQPAGTDLASASGPVSAVQVPALVTAAAVSRSTTLAETRRRARQWRAIALAGVVGLAIAVPIGILITRAPKEERVPSSITGATAPSTKSTSSAPSTTSATPATSETIAPIVMPTSDESPTTSASTSSAQSNAPKSPPTFKPKPTPTKSHAPIF